MSRRRYRRAWRKTRRYLAACWHCCGYLTLTVVACIMLPFGRVINAEVLARRGRL